MFRAHRFVVVLRYHRSIVDACGAALPALPIVAEHRPQAAFRTVPQRADGDEPGGNDRVTFFPTETRNTFDG